MTLTEGSSYHTPALEHEVVQLLAQSALVLDGTLGGGGHAVALLAAGVPNVFAVDRDDDALRTATARLSDAAGDGRFAAFKANYADIGVVPELASIRFDGILLDLGISSHQIDETARGFSFREGAPLDMRMGGDAGESAADVLNGRDEAELIAIFRNYGDETRAGRLSREIMKRRSTRPFQTSDDLVGAIRGALGPKTDAGDFARLFQAIRIAVNDEIRGLERALPDLRDRLTPGGILAIITYHSGEDRLVKHSFREWSEDCICPPRHPMCTCGGNRSLGTVITRKAIVAGADEVSRNPRARSAKLRAWRRAG